MWNEILPLLLLLARKNYGKSLPLSITNLFLTQLPLSHFVSVKLNINNKVRQRRRGGGEADKARVGEAANATRQQGQQEEAAARMIRQSGSEVVLRLRMQSAGEVVTRWHLG